MPGTAIQRHMPRLRTGHTTTVTIGGERLDLTANAHVDGSLGEVFLKWGKPGSSTAGLVDAYAVALSVCLQSGVPLVDLVHQMVDLRFEPFGDTDDPDFPHVRSVMDWVGCRLAVDWLPFGERAAEGIYTSEELACGRVDTALEDFRVELSCGVSALVGAPA